MGEKKNYWRGGRRAGEVNLPQGRDTVGFPSWPPLCHHHQRQRQRQPATRKLGHFHTSDLIFFYCVDCTTKSARHDERTPHRLNAGAHVDERTRYIATEGKE